MSAAPFSIEEHGRPWPSIAPARGLYRIPDRQADPAQTWFS
jgi:hypothetical protein